MRYVITLALIGLTCALTGCDLEDFDPGERVQSDFHFNYPLAANSTVNIDTFNGSIEVMGWDQDHIDISGTKYARTPELRDAIRIDITHSSNSVSVHAVRPTDSHGNMGARFLIHLPKKTNLDRVASSNGKIEVRGLIGTANLHTSNGHINAEQVDGPVDISTSNGHITIQDSLSSGRFPIHARTSNGAIDITAQHAGFADLHASTSNGSITVHLPDSISARVRASTSNSGITSDFEVTTQGRMDKHHLEGTINGPRGDAPLIELSTSNGHIRLSKL